MDQRTVAVIVPVYNRANTVLRTLETILRQTRMPDILVVVDDGSSDGSAEIVEQWLAKQRPACTWQVLRLPENRGASAARNRGLHAAAEYEYIAFIDSDDALAADFLERACAVIAAHPEAVAASCDRQRIRDSGALRKRSDHRRLAANPIAYTLRYAGGVLSCTLLRRDVVEELGGFDETNRVATEDTALLLRLALKGPWLHVPGEPSIQDRQISTLNKEQRNYSRSFTGTFYNWVCANEDFLANVRGWEQHISPAKADRICALLWTCASIQYARHGKFRRSVACMGTAICRFSGSLVGGRFR
ncbi:MAG: glycosyltransferase family A protein [Candidatus Peribacteraceae bacterium]|nr:glycosyltransferase family A protein [Candidatus Peribacteraceae bacterium]